MGQSIHTGVSNLLNRKGCNEIRVEDRNIRGDLKVSQRILDALCVIGDNGESGYLGCSSGSRRNCTEVSFRSQLREVERNDKIFKGRIRVLIECPHCLCGIDWRTTADGNDPVRLEFGHCLCAFHNGLNGRVWLNALEKLNFHAGFLQISLNAIEESALSH